MDYSSAGYMGGKDLPEETSIPVKMTVKPTGADDTKAIQDAIDSVSVMPLNGKFRGAVLLTRGTFRITKSLVISASGVVLRGSGSSQTIISSNIDNVVKIEGKTKMSYGKSTANKLVKKYYPFGSTTFELQTTTGLKVGDTVMMVSVISQKFIELLGMDKLVRDGKPQTWIKAGSSVTTERVISAIDKNNVTLDAAYPDSIRPDLFDDDNDIPYIREFSWENRLEHSGVENLKAINPKAQNSHQFATFDNAMNCWARDLFLQDFGSGVVTTGPATKFVTLKELQVVYTAVYLPAAPPQILSFEGTQHLHINSTITGGGKYWPLSSGSTRFRGPIVHHNINIDATAGAQAVPHMRWSTGMLYDNVINPKGSVSFTYRGIMGSGHGWTMGWGVIYNCQAKTLVASNPHSYFDAKKPVLYKNYLIGSKGTNTKGWQAKELDGTYDRVGQMVAPQSLYLAQVAARK